MTDDRVGNGDVHYDIVQPNAASIIESMRALGYSPWAAVADLIDNSISANAANVWVDIWWDGLESRISVRDDGDGMDEDTLINAMRLGSRSPLEERAPSDLGRFGLGLKTASFSQARRLTVITNSRSTPLPSIRRWDLDYVSATGEWRLLRGADPATPQTLVDEASSEHGTTVVWERLDRIVDDSKVDDDRASRRFRELIRTVETHVAMTFHRFLTGRGAVALWINRQRVKGWDPFLPDHPATQRLPIERLSYHGHSVEVAPFVLPHHSRLSRDEHMQAAGPSGWNAQQGFYVYRNRRLLVAGDWLRLGFQKEEHAKLARIRVDLPNALDSEWSIDVKKATARPPGPLREDLRRIAKITRQRATDIYRHRGKVIARDHAAEYSYVWERLQRQGKLSYRVNRKHPLVILANESAESGAVVESLLRLVEETVPVPLIALEQAQREEEHGAPYESAPASEVIKVAQLVFAALRRNGLSDADARRRLASMEPFHAFPEVVAALEGETD